MYPNTSDTCWRGCGDRGSLPHILWHCRSITSFWSQMFILILELTAINTRPDKPLAILHIGFERLSPPYRMVVLHLLLAAKGNIIKNWKTPESPSLKETICNLSSHCVMERWIAHNNNSYKKFKHSWQVWLSPPKCKIHDNLTPNRLPVVASSSSTPLLKD